MARENKSWYNLPIEIVNLIHERLCYVDQIRFRAVCRCWRSNIHSVKFAGKLPWIMAYKWQKMNDFDESITSLSFLYDPSHQRKYVIRAKEGSIFVGAEMRSSKYGWVLFSKREKLNGSISLFFYSPFTDEVMKLPELPLEIKAIDAVTFSTTPASSECEIFLLSGYSKKFRICTCNLRERTWTSLRIYGFHGNIEDVAYVEGVFYCSFSRGVMGTFRVPQEWKIYRYPPVPDFPANVSLIESDGHLLRSYYDYYRTQWRVLEFDQSQMNWSEVESVGKRSLFIGHTSISVPAEEEASEFPNTIHYLADYVCFSFHHKAFECNSCPQLYRWIEKDWLVKFWIQPPQPI